MYLPTIDEVILKVILFNNHVKKMSLIFNGNIFQSQYDNEANIVNRSSIVLIFAFYSYLGIRRHINGIQSQI